MYLAAVDNDIYPFSGKLNQQFSNHMSMKYDSQTAKTNERKTLSIFVSLTIFNDMQMEKQKHLCLYLPAILAIFMLKFSDVYALRKLL